MLTADVNPQGRHVGPNGIRRPIGNRRPRVFIALASGTLSTASCSGLATRSPSGLYAGWPDRDTRTATPGQHATLSGWLLATRSPAGFYAGSLHRGPRGRRAIPPQHATLWGWRCRSHQGLKTRRGRLPIGLTTGCRMPSGPTCALASARVSTVSHNSRPSYLYAQMPAVSPSHRIRVYISVAHPQGALCAGG